MSIEQHLCKLREVIEPTNLGLGTPDAAALILRIARGWLLIEHDRETQRCSPRVQVITPCVIVIFAEPLVQVVGDSTCHCHFGGPLVQVVTLCPTCWRNRATEISCGPERQAYSESNTCRGMAHRSFRSLEDPVRVSTGICGPWEPSVHSDVAL